MSDEHGSTDGQPVGYSDRLPVGVFRADRHGNYTYVNDWWRTLTGLGPQTGLRCGWLAVLDSSDRERVAEGWLTAVTEQRPFRCQFRIQPPEGQTVWVSMEVDVERDAVGEATGFLGILTDITSRKATEDSLRYAAYHDMLTRLPNRALFVDRLAQCIERSRRVDGYRYAVLFLDLDRFKVINDSLGHAVGDALLVAIAKRLSACLRKFDTICRTEVPTMARLGGDEFIILLDGLRGHESAMMVADRLQREVIRPFQIMGHEVHSSASIGIATGRLDYQHPEDVLRDADTALYTAKAKGPGNFALFDAAMRHRAMARIQMETDLRRAIERRQLYLQYQPILRMPEGRIISFEALVRWEHPERGRIRPDHFIPVAEDTGLIVPLGRWVLYESCRQLAQWTRDYPRNPPLSINVNVSSEQFADPRLTQNVDAVLAETGVDPRQLNLEITESIMMESTGRSIAALPELKARKISLHMDDFGTGYSSLSYLRSLPVDVVKIDREFIRDMGSGRGTDGDDTIVRTIINLVHDLGMRVTAEGVEKASQLKRLRGFGCDYAQGFYFMPPVDADDVVALLRTPHGAGWAGHGATEDAVPRVNTLRPDVIRPVGSRES